MSVLHVAIIVIVAFSFIAPAHAASKDFVIGYLQLGRDARYARNRTEARYLNQPLGRPVSGAKVAIKELQFVGSALGLAFKLEQQDAKDSDDALAKVETMYSAGVRFFVTDLPAQMLAEVAAGTRDRPIVLINASAREDSLRAHHCQRHLLHTVPSHAMANDALAQFLVAKKWRRVLALIGPSGDDRALATSFARAANRMGLKIVDSRPFVLGHDPRERDQNNVALLTAGSDYDVIFVADSDGEFARNVPFHGVAPRPVVGSEGLAGAAWHWAWERHGAPQLEGRFEKLANRPMYDFDWAAWMAVKAVAEAVVRSESDDFETVATYLRSDAIILDGFKGNPINFRPWDGQLRQPILLITHNWVVERAPLKGFLHPTNNLDTLGFDERDSQCKH